MIYVNQKQLEQVEYLIEQSAKGFHVLFDNDVIREVFREFDEFPQPNPAKEGNEQIEKHIENLILQPTLVSKRAYLENLSPDVYVRVVRTYFSIVENNIFESLKFSQ
ncbi:MAG: hypothetical protein HYW49_03835 [Deltaproteobacteria bacterium]|nr:hypothetical protein [Deltaproteobacteria bacterium]